MDSSLVYENILIALQVLIVVPVVSSANMWPETTQTENGQKHSNNQNNMVILITAWNTLINHSIIQMWKSKMWICVQFPQDHSSVGVSSVQNFNDGYVQLKEQKYTYSQKNAEHQSNAEYIYIKTSAMNTSQHTSGISSLLYVLISKSLSHRYITVIKRSNGKKMFMKKKVRGGGVIICMMDLIFNGFFKKKQKYSVCTSYEVEAGVMVMTSTLQLNGVCKLFEKSVANIAFDALFVANCSSTTLVQMYRVPTKINYDSKCMHSPASTSKLSSQTLATSSCINKSIIAKSKFYQQNVDDMDEKGEKDNNDNFDTWSN
ncbi:hypothetical protein RFI_24697 [Reticulomyxa filosa]|uniref:Uncharacterized protein n=1 Tax=Reticulomyxa filosa TaxID=46433 RepID=X6MF81_RETFI|nr:hypothetical protein RFI_24697 [Reticulomyxa filosa]|eukprot:ETO12678.1 hypothetical protein RFI_24697 [Reticulomyxa filosa]